MTTNQTSSRAMRLRKQFFSILDGKAELSENNWQQFLEAIPSQPDASACLSRIITSKQGLSALQQAMRMELNPRFFNGSASAVLECLSQPALGAIGGGDPLRRALLAVVEPPFFWAEFTRAFCAQPPQLNENSQRLYAWLLCQLLSFPSDPSLAEVTSSWRALANEPVILDCIATSPNEETRALGEKIRDIISVRTRGKKPAVVNGPGGRHNNDKVDFHDISIVPTAEEIQSRAPPFLRIAAALEDPECEETRVSDYLDNQFRLGREDMLYEIREAMQYAMKRKSKSQRSTTIGGLRLANVHNPLDIPARGRVKSGTRWAISFSCADDLTPLKKLKDTEERKKWLAEVPNRWFLRNGSMACIMAEDKLLAFGTIVRNENLLASKPPVIVIRIEGESTIIDALLRLRSGLEVKLIQIDTALFAYYPVLKALQDIQSLPMSRQLLLWSKADEAKDSSSSSAYSIADFLRENPRQDLQPILETSKSIILDKSQHASLMQGLMRDVSLIQGPPGTGKSFIGALLAKAIYKYSSRNILVVCYTNHALDQFLEDLLDIGIPSSAMVRLGSKWTPRTEPLSLKKVQKVRAYNRTRDQWNVIESLKDSIRGLDGNLRDASSQFRNRSQGQDILEYLEFEEPDMYGAFVIPEQADGMRQVAENGKAVQEDYLLQRWLNGSNGGIFKKERTVRQASQVWSMRRDERRARYAKWEATLGLEQAERINDLARTCDARLEELERKFDEDTQNILRSMRIIGCTTTAAAMYKEAIRAASPDVLLVEEAGEILESHIVTALGPETKQLILIGDHKQLRPKVNNYLLTVEKGEGYDLNRSLFERLVLKGYPHEALLQQHRMRPEISALVRHLMYPDLTDAPSTHGRDNLRGVRSNVVFIHHDKPEGELKEANGLQATEDAAGSQSSKTNYHEVGMVLKIVRYLGQQGYGTDKLVILTPYLGQLRALQQALLADTDPMLNDLDSADLIRAGLISSATAKMIKKPIRLATVDNYQGEESEIVVVSLTRSNPDNSIGFMRSEERINVLLSRARNALIMIGNAHTFQRARNGGKVWTKLITKLREDGYMYDGLPIRCERHPDREATLSSPLAFDEISPDGGCTQDCGVKLSCGHVCPSKCHQIDDHSKMPCHEILRDKCDIGHSLRWKCCDGRPDSCQKCEKIKREAERRAQEDFARQERLEQEQKDHDRQMAEVQAQIEQQRDLIREQQRTQERKDALEQRKRDLEDAKASVTRAATRPPTPPPKTLPQSTKSSETKPSVQGTQQPSTPSNADPAPVKADINRTKPSASAAEADWANQKAIEGASCDAIDAIMNMTGLEQVKLQILAIKAQVDLAQRQNLPPDGRYNIAFLGNPGTGKTTVARHYGRFLAQFQLVSGTEFHETTGSRLADDGVKGAKNIVDSVKQAGGGVIFIDEAYQLTASHNMQGTQVLDFLLAEMENNRGKLVFIVAGYTKEMEKFFEHNPGIPSRVPHRLRFEDYTDDELLTMLESMTDKKWKGRMKIEGPDGIRGLYGRIAIRRLGRGRGRDGFGNARELENTVDRITARQASRLKKQRSKSVKCDDFLWMKEDIIGPDPAKVLVESTAYKKLNGMIGLELVKDTVANLFEISKNNYQRELRDKEPDALNLNRVFIGPPGTGKTTVAKHYGQILADLGMISNGEVVVKNPADFIGAHLGQSESQTKAILASSVGKVLVIDEAYMLYGGKDGGNTDSFKTAVIDTIVAEVQSKPGDDRCVLLLGYKDQMEEMFQNVNPGLSRRFAMEDAFVFESYSESQLLEALRWKMAEQDRSATPAAEAVAMEVLGRLRNRPNFGNIGEVENLLGKAKLHFQKRMKILPAAQRKVDAPFEPQDFDPDYDRNKDAGTNLNKLFEDVVGCDAIVQKLREIQMVAASAKARNLDPRELVPTNFVFKGPPGTGKTTTARKMGQVYYDMGFLSSTEVVECSASDLVGQYIGHTGPKTRKLFEKALGRVLFVDEAYRLSEGQFAKEAMDEIVGLLTHESFRGKLLVILAGYDNEMNELLATNPGLGSRFPDEVQFENLPPHQCVEVLRKVLAKKQVTVAALEDQDSSAYRDIIDLLGQLASISSWGNARDLQTLAKNMIKHAFLFNDNNGNSGGDAITLSDQAAIKCISTMLNERRARASRLPVQRTSRRNMLPSQIFGPLQAPTPPTTQVSTTVAEASLDAPPPPYTEMVQSNSEEEEAQDDRNDSSAQDWTGRDPGVSDQVWAELQAARRAEEQSRERRQELMRSLQEATRNAALEEQKTRNELAELERRAAQAAQDKQLKRLREEARLRDLEAKRRRAQAEEEARKMREEEERRSKEEARVQAKIRSMGVCPASYQWIKMPGGYRCAGGVCWIDDASLGL